MENNEVKTKKVNKKLLRLIIGVSLVVVSLATGVLSGIKIAKVTSIADNSKDENIQYIEEIIQILKDNWMSEIYYGTNNVNEDLLIRQFVGALSSSEEKRLDGYTYLIKNEPPVYVTATGKLGITLTNFYNIPVITEVSKEGSGYNILKPGDIVVRLGKQNKSGKYEYVNITEDNINFSNMFELGLGAPNSTQYIKVARFDENKQLNYHEFEIVLGGPTPSYYSELIDEDIDDTIMVKVSGFTADEDNKNGTVEQLERILKNDDSSNLILDFRGNPGGSVSSAINLCDLFLPKDKVITTLQYKGGRKVNYVTSDNKVYDYENIIILQDQDTASASEITIAALMHHLGDKVTLVGTKSYGKGIATKKVQVFGGQYTLQYTLAKWLTPDGSWIGMDTGNGNDVAISPLEENIISHSDTYAIADYCAYYMRYYGLNFYKDSASQEAFIVDKVAVENQLFFEVYNSMFNTSYRTDSYFDASCSQALKDYQTLRNIDVTGEMDLDTLVCFTYDYYDLDKQYHDSFVNKAVDIIEG